MNYLENHVEALIFCSTEPITLTEIQQCLSEMLDTIVPESDIQSVIDTLLQKYKSDNYAFHIQALAGGYQFLTKQAYFESIELLLKQKTKKQLSKSSLETLAIIAYKQPITKAEIENIRGVNSDYAVQKLLDRELIYIKGKADTAGHPLLYATTSKFMEYFGINSLEELPQPKDFSEPEPSETVEND